MRLKGDTEIVQSLWVLRVELEHARITFHRQSGVSLKLVDATQRGGEPGTVYLIEPDPAADGTSPDPDPDDGTAAMLARMSLLNAHGMQPDLVLSLAGTLGAEAGRVLVVGCEPASLEEGIGLSAPVAAAVDDAVRMVTRLVTAGPEAGPEDGQEMDVSPESTKG